MASSASKRYARAVYELAQENGAVDQWQQDLEVLAAIINDPETGSYLQSPKVREAERLSLLDGALKDSSPEARRLAEMLVKRQRLEIAPEMLEVFQQLVLEDQGIAIADVTTAVPLDADSEKLVEQQLSELIGKKLEVRYHVDPSIIGGLVARVGDTLVDGSVSSQLRRMHDRLSLASR